jgi:hypothetical protein
MTPEASRKLVGGEAQRNHRNPAPKNAKQAAEQDARNTVGVYAVKNHIKVRPVNPPPDERLDTRL